MAEIEILKQPWETESLAFKNEVEVQSALYVANSNTCLIINKYVNI